MKIVDTYVLYKIIRRLSTPFDQWEMCRSGVIDANGNFIVAKELRTDEQLSSYSYFDVLMLNLKKILAKVPGGSSRIATFAAALYLLREGKNADPVIFEGRFTELLNITMQMLSEEGEGGGPVPANNTTNIVDNPKLIKFKNYKKGKKDAAVQ